MLGLYFRSGKGIYGSRNYTYSAKEILVDGRGGYGGARDTLVEVEAEAEA